MYRSRTSSLRKLVVALTTIALVTPTATLTAADAPSGKPARSVQLPTHDVELQANGTLKGYFVDGEQGAAKSGVTLTLHQDSAKAIATVKTGENGEFAFSGLKAGTYQVIADGEQIMAYRAWARGTAPPKAPQQVVFAAGDSTRAALWFAGLPPEAQLGIIAAIVAAVAVPIAVYVNDDDDKKPNSPMGGMPM